LFVGSEGLEWCIYKAAIPVVSAHGCDSSSRSPN